MAQSAKLSIRGFESHSHFQIVDLFFVVRYNVVCCDCSLKRIDMTDFVRNNVLRLSRLQRVWVKTLKTGDRVKIDRRHKNLVNMKSDFKCYSFLVKPFFVYNGVLYKDPSLKI